MIARITRLSACLGTLIAGLALQPKAWGGEQRLTVVELFTSQGCSSCPAADALLGELAERPNLLAVSEHVDYWDYLGWKDPFASVTSTQRQRDYARLLSMRYIYTPQMVVQGAVQVAGNNREAVLDAIDSLPATEVPISLSWRDPAQLTISVGSGNGASSARIWIVTFDRVHQTQVPAGENRGRELRNFNVVRSLTATGTWVGTPLELVANMDAEHWSKGSCAVLLQAEGGGPILGAARCGSAMDHN